MVADVADGGGSGETEYRGEAEFRRTGVVRDTEGRGGEKLGCCGGGCGSKGVPGS